MKIYQKFKQACLSVCVCVCKCQTQNERLRGRTLVKRNQTKPKGYTENITNEDRKKEKELKSITLLRYKHE